LFPKNRLSKRFPSWVENEAFIVYTFCTEKILTVFMENPMHFIHKLAYKGLILTLATAFTLSSLPQLPAQADPLTAVGLMPAPGSMSFLTPKYTPAYLKGMVINPTDPFKFEFIIYRGDEQLGDQQKQAEYTKLIKYFLAAMAIPDTDQWVNLSPYEKERLIPKDFGLTVMGRDLLAQDYLLKQISSSLTNPNTSMGKKFWDTIYEKAYAQFGLTNIPINTFNKVWIVPDKALIYEKDNTVYVVQDHLKVMTDADYLSMKKHGVNPIMNANTKAMNLSNQVTREIIIPAIEKEVNEGKNFAPLRQVFSGMLLATWYKRALKESILTKLYADSKKVKGVDQNPKNNEKIYAQYLKAFKKGAYNMIKEDTDRLTQEIVPRKYFSGGLRNEFARVMRHTDLAQASRDFAQKSSNIDMVSAAMTAQHLQKYLYIPKGLKTFAAGVVMAGVLSTASGQTVTLKWDPPVPEATNFSGYIIFRGTNSGVYTSQIDVGNVTQVTIPAQPGVTNYFAAIDYTTSKEQSGFSNEANYVPPPNIGNPLPPPKILSPLPPKIPLVQGGGILNPNGLPQMVLSWPANTDINTVGYYLYASTSPDIDPTNNIYDVRYNVGTNNSFTISMSQANSDYWVVTAFDKYGRESTSSAVFTAIPVNPPDRISSFQISPLVADGQQTIQLSWAPSNANGYYVYEGTSTNVSTSNYISRYDGTNTSINLPAEAGIRYFFVTGYNTNSSGVRFESPPSYEIPVTNGVTVPPFALLPSIAPYYNIQLSKLPAGAGMQLTWDYDGSIDDGSETVLQISPDLKDWTDIATNLNISPAWSQFIDTNSPQEKLFYRFEYVAPPATYNFPPNQAMSTKKNAAAITRQWERGGIDLNSRNLDLQIKRDGKGVPLPVSQQNLDNIRFDGLAPEILNIKPASDVTLFNQSAA
jgi:hypothetical protein